jgi:hypothetical protein
VDDVVTATIVGNEVEAEVVCGLLRSNGIPCSFRKTDLAVGAWDSVGQAGPTAILVAAKNLDRAKALLSS